MTKKSLKATISVTKPHDDSITITAEELIAAFRSYVGVPYRAGGRDRRGTDCGGLLLMVGHDIKVTDLEVVGYSQNPDGKTFEHLLNSVLIKVKPKTALRPGDIIACDYGEGIQHTAFVVDKQSPNRILVIHAKRQHGVTEQFLHGVDRRGWRATYRLRNIA